MTEARLIAPDGGFKLALPAELVEAIAERVAEIVLARQGAPDAGSPYLTVAEAAELLRCKRQRVDDLLSKRVLTRVKDGARTLVLRAEIDGYLARGTTPARRV